MNASSLIAGSLGFTVVGGLLVILTAAGAVALFALAPARNDAGVRSALVDARDDLAWCAAGTDGGELTVTLALARGEARHVGVVDATVTQETAQCVADALVSRPWPNLRGAATVPVRFER